MDARMIKGLTTDEAELRLKTEGYNELPSSKRRTTWGIALSVAREPMFLLLVACGIFYLLAGREDVADALMLLSFVFVVMGITIVQERRTERALEALKDLSSPRALVIRDGEKKRVAGRDVVRGDMVILAEGDRVPADGVLLESLNLSADESLLTGESVPVRKMAGDGTESAMGKPGGDDLPFVYSGTLVTQGQGIAEIRATGLATELGKIGKALSTVVAEQTLLQKETRRLVRNLAVLGLGLCAMVIVVYGMTRGNNAQAWQHGLLAGLTMAMATLPEEFPVVLTIFLALGAWRISQFHVLTRRMPIIETLGAATALCVDKTGTLTLNRMAVRELYAQDKLFDAENPAAKRLPEDFHELLEFGILASKRDPFDPMERALRQLGERFLAKTEHLHHNWELLREYPLSANLLALSHVWKSPDGSDFIVAAKGAPEAVIDLCHLDAEQQRDLSRRVELMAEDGLRVLGVAKGHFRSEELPSNQHDLEFDFVGLVGLADPVRPTVPGAIAECYTAGVRVIMITGDYAGTARKIAREIGLRNSEEVITGAELEGMGDKELAERIRSVNVFARAVPEQKLRIVNALKRNGEIVAMTGDGVNDAPALKSAHIGIAMGERGTDVARESAGLVLLDDDFSSIVAAIRVGRRIFDNIKKAISYIFAIHVPIVGLSMVPIFSAEWPLILLPVHVVFLELIIDPASSILFEAESPEPGVMTRPPRNPNEPLFGLHSIGLSLLQGVSVLAILLAVFAVGWRMGGGEDKTRTLTFATLIIANLALILTNRSWTMTVWEMRRIRNGALWWIVGGAAGFLALTLTVPFLRGLFHFGKISAADFLLCLAGGVLSIVWFEGLKVVRRRKGTVVQPASSESSERE